MQHRILGKNDVQLPALGFGCMRLPTADGDSARIDRGAASEMLRYAMDRGVNYFDTAYDYHRGDSELFLGEFLRDGLRSQAHIATKLPAWLVHEPADMDRIFAEQLGRLQTDYVDMYLLHNLRRDYWQHLLAMGVLPWLERQKSAGRIHHLGFSFHAGFEVLQEVVEAFDGWEFCQVQYNYLDVDYNAGARGVAYAASRGLGVICMEPLLGGKLAAPGPSVQALWDSAKARRTPADWALQWLWDQPEVSLVLSGMSTLEQVRENVASAERSGPGTLDAEEQALVARVRQLYLKLCPTRCTGCKYCEPCPNGVDISILFKALNQAVMSDDLGGASHMYAGMADTRRASNCVQCRTCEERCPQGIAISDWMQAIHEVLGEGQDYIAARYAAIR